MPTPETRKILRLGVGSVMVLRRQWVTYECLRIADSLEVRTNDNLNTKCCKRCKHDGQTKS
jgi:hypothetical protein